MLEFEATYILASWRGPAPPIIRSVSYVPKRPLPPFPPHQVHRLRKLPVFLFTHSFNTVTLLLFVFILLRFLPRDVPRSLPGKSQYTPWSRIYWKTTYSCWPNLPDLAAFSITCKRPDPCFVFQINTPGLAVVNPARRRQLRLHCC